MSLALILLMTVKTVRYHSRQPTGRWLLALLIGLLGYFVKSIIDEQAGWSWLETIAILLSITIPACFWFLCLSLFRDRLHLRWFHWLLSLIYIALDVAGYVVYQLGIEGGDLILQIVTFYLPQAIKLLIVVLSVIAIVQNWDADLVEQRRQIRFISVLIAGFGIGGVITAEFVAALGAPATPTIEAIYACFIFAVVLVATLWIADGGLDGFVAMLPPEKSAPARQETVPPLGLDDVGQRKLAELNELIDTQKVYREHGLTIGGLAKKLDLPEYQLRRLINRHLGFRNFNDYLNSVRIREAAQRLADPAQQKVPILTLALDSGYSSLPPFNRAFKAEFGLTPTEFRQQNGKKSDRF